MSLVVTATQAVWVFDPDTRIGYRVDEGNGVYYGVTHDEEGHIFVAARRCPYGVDVAGRAAQTGVILVFDRDFTKLDELVPPFPLRDLHQIYRFDGKLWVCCSFDNMIAVYDGRNWERWYPYGPSPAHLENPDIHHINSIWSEGGDILMTGHRGWNGSLHVFDKTTLTLRRSEPFGVYSHNIWRERGVLQTLSSLNGVICGHDGRERVVSAGNFVRGAAVTDTALHIGVSEKVSRAERGFGCCEVVTLSPEGSTVAVYGLTRYGMVHDIRSPGVFDAAHPSAVGLPVDTARLGRFHSEPLSGRTIPVTPS